MPLVLTPADRLDIYELISACAWALDTADVTGFVACFSSEGALVWDSFETPLLWNGHAELRQFIEGLRDLPESAGRQHFVGNIRIRGEVNGAQASAYVLVTLREANGTVRTHVAGYYDDDFCVENGAWRIRRRTIRDWCGPVLARFAGQTGEPVRRKRPAALDALLRRPT